MFAWPSCGAPNYFAAGAAALFVAMPELAGVVFSTLTTMQPVKKKAAPMTNAAPIRILFFIFWFLCLFQPQSRLVRIAGLEPAIVLLSSLYIFAFLYTSLLVMLRHYPHDCKLIFASVGN